ncbi:tetratricopeptide repeat protein, partial [Streptomyces erythrochromogenes]|uniref:tetratricopeptide repeat protein n=1 Tax=Streptomyces erythrochromogenes TaxID=285574 RepID=UPI0036827BB9
MLVLVGTSSTGKTRACWEAVQPLAGEGWRLWHPFDPTRADAALADLERVQPRTVLWLNEAQHYLGHSQLGEQVAAALHGLLTDSDRGPVLVLGTLWPEYERDYRAMPSPDRPDPHSRVRELLAGRTISVPSTFDEDALCRAAALADEGDELLADALTRASVHGQLAQDLAGAPELLQRYEHSTPAARALLEVAMDARRLRVGLHLPQTFLTDAATDYLNDSEYEQLTDDWAEAAYSELARPVHGKQAPLRRTAARPERRLPGSPLVTPTAGAGPAFRLADYLEQHGRTTRGPLCPPASFWHAAHSHLTHPNDLNNLAMEAYIRHRLQWEHHLSHKAAQAGNPYALAALAEQRTEAGDHDGAEALYRQAADAGDPEALIRLAERREEAGDHDGAEALYRQAADAGDPEALSWLAEIHEDVGDREGAEALYRQAADAGDPGALFQIVRMREEARDREGAEALCQEAASSGDTFALMQLAEMREYAGDHDGAEALYREAAEKGDTDAVAWLAEMLEEAGDHDGAIALYQHHAAAGSAYAQHHLAEMREAAGDWEGAEALYWPAANEGDTYALIRLSQIREAAGDHEGANALCQQAAEGGDSRALVRLAMKREATGDHDGAEALYWEAAGTG